MGKVLKFLAGIVIIISFAMHCMHTGQRYVPGEVLIKFKANTDSTEMDSLCKAIGLEKVEEIQHINVSRYKIITQMTVEEVIDKYKDDPHIEYIEPNYTIHLNK